MVFENLFSSIADKKTRKELQSAFKKSDFAKTFGSLDEGATTASMNAIRAEAAARSAAYRQNAALLQFDAAQYRQVGEQVFGTEYRKGLQRTASASAEYAASGVRLEGSAQAVAQDIQRESLREATAQRQQYEFAARKATKQAEIQNMYAALETQAGEYKAQAVYSNAQSQLERSFLQYKGQVDAYNKSVHINWQPSRWGGGASKMMVKDRRIGY